MATETFVDRDQVQVSFRRWDVVAPRGAVVLSHGASEYADRYARFAIALNKAGWSVLAPDHRGHGGTAAATGRGVIGPRGMAGIIDDLDEMVSRATPAGPVVLFGHSMGSVIALRYAQLHGSRLAALALCGSPGAMPGTDDAIAPLEGAVAAGMGTEPMDALAPFNEAFEPARTPFDWLSRDDAEVDAYIADPDCGSDLPLTYGYVLEVLTAVRDGAADVKRLPKDLPVLITAGERDPAGAFTENVRALAQLLREAGIAVTEKYYPDARHEILNETNREEVTSDIVSWIDTVTA